MFLGQGCTQQILWWTLSGMQSKLAVGILGRAMKLCKEKNIKAESFILEVDPKDMIRQIVKEIHVESSYFGESWTWIDQKVI